MTQRFAERMSDRILQHVVTGDANAVDHDKPNSSAKVSEILLFKNFERDVAAASALLSLKAASTRTLAVFTAPPVHGDCSAVARGSEACARRHGFRSRMLRDIPATAQRTVLSVQASLRKHFSIPRTRMLRDIAAGACS